MIKPKTEFDIINYLITIVEPFKPIINAQSMNFQFIY